MKNEILIDIAGAILLFFACYLGGFLGGLIFGITVALLFMATVGSKVYKKASNMENEAREKILNILKKAADDNTVNPGS